METIPFLTTEDVAALDGLLSDFIQKSEAEMTVVVDKGGIIIAENGKTGTIDMTIVAALAAGSFAATKELASRIGELEFSALYHQGKKQHIFMSSVDEYTIIITVFGERTTVGLVRFYITNVTAQLASLLKRLRNREPSEPQFLLQDKAEVAEKIFV
jgi:predicted regulator of Ras-like GTPase activity (Roadblock/LC7/MglB family)